MNSFLAAGYDTLDVISEIDDSEQSGNSLSEIEELINSEYPGESRFQRDRSSASSFRFAPGHRRRIVKFVHEIAEHLHTKQVHKPRKRLVKTRLSKCKHSGDSSTSGTDSSLPNEKTAVALIRQQLAKWQRSQSDVRLQQLKEHKDFEVNFTITESDTVSTYIKCSSCSRKLALGCKEGTIFLSNWTRHIIKCVRTPQSSVHAVRIDSYFSTPSPRTSSTEHSSCSTPSTPESSSSSVFSPIKSAVRPLSKSGITAQFRSPFSDDASL